MRSSRHIAKWLIITLIMAIGIGTFAALTVRNEKEKEETEAQSSTYLTNQRQKDIDMKELKTLLGDFDAENGQWHLVIDEDFEDKGPYMSLKDGGTGFEGRIMYLKKGIVIVEIDEDLLPVLQYTLGDLNNVEVRHPGLRSHGRRHTSGIQGQ